jgi:hypothetical protein
MASHGSKVVSTRVVSTRVVSKRVVSTRIVVSSHQVHRRHSLACGNTVPMERVSMQCG